MDKMIHTGAPSSTKQAKKLKKQAKREAKAMQVVEQARRDLQKAEQKLARASRNVQKAQTHLLTCEANLEEVRSARRTLQGVNEPPGANSLEQTIEELIAGEQVVENIILDVLKNEHKENSIQELTAQEPSQDSPSPVVTDEISRREGIAPLSSGELSSRRDEYTTQDLTETLAAEPAVEELLIVDLTVSEGKPQESSETEQGEVPPAEPESAATSTPEAQVEVVKITEHRLAARRPKANAPGGPRATSTRRRASSNHTQANDAKKENNGEG